MIVRSIAAFAVSVAAALTAPAQTRQNPTDLQILARVQTALRHEPAFAGMMITPSVSHGVVSLNGSVDSRAAKVLASDEAGAVAGVKTVLNNLDVAAAAAPPPPPAPKPAEATVSRTITLPPETVLSVRMEDELSSKTARANDTFRGTIASSVAQDGFTLIPVGTPVTGRVIDSKGAGRLTGQAQLSLELVSIDLPAAGGGPKLSVVTDPWSSKESGRGTNTAEKTGGGAAVGAIIGALAGGGSGAAIGAASGGALGAGTNAATHGKQVEIKPEQLLQFKTASPLEISVHIRDGRQVEPALEPGPSLQTRPALQ